MSKPCPRCGLRARKGRGYCTPCAREYQRERGEQGRRKPQKRNPEAERARSLRYSKERPEIKRAHKAVVRALRSGALTKPDRCARSSASCAGQLEAHHADYSKPLDVEWLCRAHHARAHRLD